MACPLRYLRSLAVLYRKRKYIGRLNAHQQFAGQVTRRAHDAFLHRTGCRKPRRRAEKGRHAQALSQRQSALDLAARGSDHRLGDAVCGDLQQPRGVRSRQGPRKHRYRHSGSGRKLVVGFHQHQTDLQAPAGREMARWPAVHGQGRAMHLADADRQDRDPGLQAQSAKSLVHQAAGRQRSTAITRRRSS